MTLPPCLIVDAIHVDGHEVSADLQIGPRHERIVIDLSIPGFIEHKKIPQPLRMSLQAQRALFAVMDRAYCDEAVELPMDLSSTARNVSEPWPLRPTPEYDSAGPVDIQITKAEHDTPEHQMTTAQLQVLGIPTTVIIENQNYPKSPTRFNFVSGVHPWQLTDEEAWAMLLALSKATVR